MTRNSMYILSTGSVISLPLYHTYTIGFSVLQDLIVKISTVKVVGGLGIYTVMIM